MDMEKACQAFTKPRVWIIFTTILLLVLAGVLFSGAALGKIDFNGPLSEQVYSKVAIGFTAAAGATTAATLLTFDREEGWDNPLKHLKFLGWFAVGIFLLLLSGSTIHAYFKNSILGTILAISVGIAGCYCILLPSLASTGLLTGKDRCKGVWLTPFANYFKLDRFDPCQTASSDKDVRKEEYIPLFPQRSASQDEEKNTEMQLISVETPSVRTEMANFSPILGRQKEWGDDTQRSLQRRLAEDNVDSLTGIFLHEKERSTQLWLKQHTTTRNV